MADEPFHPVPLGSQSDYARPRTGPFKPSFFSEHEFQTVVRLVELFLGSLEPAGEGHDTENVVQAVSEWIDLRLASSAEVRRAARRLSSEHRVLAVHFYGAEAVTRLENEEPERTCRECLDWLERESRQRYGMTFIDLDQAPQMELSTEISDARRARAPNDAGARLFDLLK